ncbi:MAG: DMT family transporter [Anaerolineae bacterium]|nr:DMT family transporter [Anaerolineae bacterium]
MATDAPAGRPDTSPWPYVILILSAVAFGFSAIFARLAAEAPALVIATWRATIAALAMTLPFLAQSPAARRLDAPRRRAGLLGGLLFAVSLAVFHIALERTTAANATFLGNLAPLWVGVITLLVLRRALPRLFWPGMAVALLGAGLMVFSEGGLTGVHSGDLIIFANSTIWAAYQVLTGEARARISALTWGWMVTGIGMLILIPLTLLRGYSLTGYDGPTIAALVAAGLISQFGGFMGYNYALGYVPVARASVINLLQPVITAVVAALLLGEPFGGWRLAGGALVLTGIYVATRPGYSRLASQQAAEA